MEYVIEVAEYSIRRLVLHYNIESIHIRGRPFHGGDGSFCGSDGSLHGSGKPSKTWEAGMKEIQPSIDAVEASAELLSARTRRR